jgi:hypothetical protein
MSNIMDQVPSDLQDTVTTIFEQFYQPSQGPSGSAFVSGFNSVLVTPINDAVAKFSPGASHRDCRKGGVHLHALR